MTCFPCCMLYEPVHVLQSQSYKLKANQQPFGQEVIKLNCCSQQEAIIFFLFPRKKAFISCKKDECVCTRLLVLRQYAQAKHMCLLNIKCNNQGQYTCQDRNGSVDSLIAVVSLALAFTKAAHHHFNLPGMKTALKR